MQGRDVWLQAQVDSLQDAICTLQSNLANQQAERVKLQDHGHDIDAQLAMYQLDWQSSQARCAELELQLQVCLVCKQCKHKRKLLSFRMEAERSEASC